MTGTGERASQPGDSGLVLVLNSGSSSVKFALVDPGSGQRRTDGLAERVGTPEAVLRTRRSPDDTVTERHAARPRHRRADQPSRDRPGAGRADR